MFAGFWDKTACLLHTQHILDAGLCVVQQIWFEILLFSGQKVHFWILYSFLPPVFFILVSHSDITKNHRWWHIEDIDCQEVRRRWHIWTRLKQWYNWIHSVPVFCTACTGWQMALSILTLILILLTPFRHLWFMTAIISIKIKNTRNYVNAFSSSVDESTVE